MDCTPVALSPSPAEAQETAQLRQQIEAQSGLTAEQLQQRRALPFASALPYDPLAAAGVDLIQGSTLAASADESARLGAHGFSIAEGQSFPTFTYGYASIYLADLPVYISADSILHVVHKGYDTILKNVEVGALRPDVEAMLTTMRGRLGGGAVGWLSADERADLDLYLALGLSLLQGKRASLVAGGDASLLDELYGKAVAGQGAGSARLFGLERDYDFSQFTPRGHYTESDELKQYFRAMMWFGRTEFRLIEALPNGEQAFRRRQLAAALGLVELLGDDAGARFERVDRTIGAFAGEHDSMTPGQARALRDDLGLGDGAGLDALGDEALARAIVDGGYGAQRIASQIAVNGTGKTLPLNRSFQLFGQRYTVDSHVFSNVVFDRVNRGATMRMMPSPLDAAYAALGNDQAAALLAPELTRYSYAPDLEAMRILVDAHGPSYWDGSLNTLWMSSLRALSPSASGLAGAGLPAVATTEAWGRRVLNAQLASWAELRHDTLLYAKQSYTGAAGCEFPDAYVDPYPEFYASLVHYAERGKLMTEGLEVPGNPSLAKAFGAHFDRLREVAARLGDMAARQRTGEPFTAEQMAFVNDAVVVKKNNEGCVTVLESQGWYPGLIVGDPLEFDPTIADVHTQPTDEFGTPVGRVLHVATGGPRRMIVTVETCSGPRAYVGLVSSYGEQSTEQYKRLTDEEWQQSLGATPSAAAPAPAWLSGVVGP